ncbi:MAG: 4-hydroxythreonine-4-phosphate dehydrogenase PdxA [Ignavibacteria bacterium RIFCSPLOWO2_02_FULL_55_14]|nr:MAG: 4-hydroxythreonine-4-phosphate dehydrogenase PdxA [Ignavibacteria bacterium RIFCSPLOWO2_02_FULL_55_14]
MKRLVAFTVGDFNGVGPEVALKAALHPSVLRIARPILVGPLDIFRHAARLFKCRVELERAVFPALTGKHLQVVDVGDGIWADVKFGAPTKSSGRSAVAAIERAVELCVNGSVEAMVTAPTSKEALHLAGYSFPGQTEMVTLFSGSQKVIMMLVSPSLRVGLVTVHAPLKDVPGLISKEKIVEKINLMLASLQRDFAVKKPALAMLGLNPHAGEAGHIGSEELSVLQPALDAARTNGARIDGPFPADAFFGTQAYKRYDGVLAMYHDQGLIPLKLLSFGKAVNVSCGLSIVRTSPDHGTAYDIAGKGKADASSMVEAVRTAVAIAKNRSSAA